MMKSVVINTNFVHYQLRKFASSRISEALLVDNLKPHVSPVTVKLGDIEESELVAERGSVRKTALPVTYSKLCSWRSQDALCDQLLAGVVYHEPADPKAGGLVVINKPYGLPAHHAKDSHYSLESSLPGLAKRLDLEKLIIVNPCERFSSGITVLGSADSTVSQYRAAVKRNKANRSLPSAYLALVKGLSKLDLLETVDMKQEKVSHIAKPVIGSQHKEPVIDRELMKSRFKANMLRVKLCRIRARTLSNGALSPTSLVVMEPSRTNHHFLSVYMADVGHAIIGDQLYDYRCRGMLGHPVKFGPGHSSATRNQILQENILGPLELTKGEEWKIPKLLHHHRLCLPSYLGRNKHLTVFAPPPPHFYQTCDALGVTINFKDIAESDSISTYDAREKPCSDSQESDGKYEDFETHIQKLGSGIKSDKMLTVLPKIHKKKRGIYRPDTLGRSY